MNTIKGDLLQLAEQGEFDVIAHGCNCFNTMGAGIARQIKDKWPWAYDADADTIKGDRRKVGTFTSATSNDGKLTVINAYTQYDYNSHGGARDLFEYAGFDRILEQLAKLHGNKRFGFPRIGQGLAGGDATRIMASLAKFHEIITQQGGSVSIVEWSKS